MALKHQDINIWLKVAKMSLKKTTKIPAYSTRLRRKNDVVKPRRLLDCRDLSLFTLFSLLRLFSLCSLFTLPDFEIFRTLVGVKNDGAFTTITDCVELRPAIVFIGDVLPLDETEMRAGFEVTAEIDLDEDRLRFSSSKLFMRSLIAFTRQTIIIGMQMGTSNTR